MRLRETKLDGCFEIYPAIHEDGRGLFVKTFHAPSFSGFGLETHFAEDYYSYSRKGVLRGLHFQVPPADHCKLVYCVCGKVFDAVVDLRVGSATYGEFEIFELNDEKRNLIYIPRGMAHGFYVLSDGAILLYKTTTVYAPEYDSGIRWDSVGIQWPTVSPLLSKRDAAFVTLGEFQSPFILATNSSLPSV